MAHRSPQELLLELRTYLQHFEQTGDLGAIETVAEIKRRIHERIREVEAQLRMSPPRRGPVTMQSSDEVLTARIAS
jgi:hypothetical protein